MSQMEQYILFDPSASSGRRVLLLQGISGSGKTQIAYNFCVRNFERFWGIFWVNATNESTAKLSFQKMAHILGTTPTIDNVKEYLSAKEDWLLVIDDEKLGKEV
ncbi:Similar to tetratricopeptide repeat domain protein [Neosartorya fischeri NRRL 181]; acc. no. XP_001262752 [Pyronema omphalodes CBS 100304]|uniref:Similar to tetratricopeptide repeat domain protein [Neosartorya fischeri NRRL 181] acc. no. XP_001262752 n=1 Tax=Pyronema omphalodes (strain CBS 100304) TaxID=1076935 RepID=U4KXW2_PYROM|nr:Similar to tetratricopeptide repeat domain protein [Neosartorya fischeri NRRL 181]; acc. no. XP_001262752 [Pyronema omphalodes CBS 100304]